MKIAYLINQYPKVSHTFVRREIQALEQLGFEIFRYSIRSAASELVDANDHIEQKKTICLLESGLPKLAWSTLKLFFTRPLKFGRALSKSVKMSRKSDRSLLTHFAYLMEASRLQVLTSTQRVQHIHAHFGTNSAEVAMLCRILGGPTWSFTVHGPEEFDRAPIIGLAEKIKSANFVVAVSSFGRSQLMRITNYTDWPKINVVRCGVSTAYLRNEASSSDSSKLVCVGRLCEQKGQLLLVEAAEILTRSGLSFEIVLVGDGEMRDIISSVIHKAGMDDRVRITGWCSEEEVREEILSARALVLPSFAEGLPVAIMEAMALRRPVISTYVAGIPELVESGKSGWLVPAGDVNALVEAIKDCISRGGQSIDAMGSQARHAVAERHDSAIEAKKLSILFSETLRR